MANLVFKRIALTPADVPAPPTVARPKVRTAKWTWVVVYANGTRVAVESARSRKDAVYQAMWTIRETTGQLPMSHVAAVYKRSTRGHVMVVYTAKQVKR